MNKHMGMACKTCLGSFEEVKYLNLNFWELYWACKGECMFKYVNIEGIWAMMNGIKLLIQTMGLQQWAVPKE